MTGKKVFVLGLVIFSFNGWSLAWANAQYKNHGSIFLSSGPQPGAAQEMAPSKAPAADESTLTGKMLKGKAVPPERQDTPYPAPELKKPGAKDMPYPPPELKKPTEPKKPAAAVPAPPTPPAKTGPVEPATPVTRPPLQPRGE